MLFWLLLLTPIIKITIGEDTKITISPGAFFNEVKETIMYDKSIPLIYTQNILKDKIDNFGESMAIENYCKNKKSNYCSIIHQSLMLLKNLNNNINENDIDTMEFLDKNNKKKDLNEEFNLSVTFIIFVVM